MLLYVVFYSKQQQTQQAKCRPGSAAVALAFGVPASSWWWKRVGGHLGGRPSGKAPDRRIGRVGPSLEWLQAGKNGQVSQDQADFMRAGTRIRPPSPGNRAFAGSDSSIVFTFAGRHPPGIEAAAMNQRLASGSHDCSAKKSTAQNALQAIFPGVRGVRAGQWSENAVAGLLRGHFSPFKPSCPSRKASPLPFEDFLTVV